MVDIIDVVIEGEKLFVEIGYKLTPKWIEGRSVVFLVPSVLTGKPEDKYCKVVTKFAAVELE